MRLDYFLKVSRLVKRRPFAKEMCDKKLVELNGQTAKAGKELFSGDTITLNFPHRRLKVRVEHVPERAISRKDASTLYSIIEELQECEDELLW
ncbi:hypothetical protein CSB45_13645 [candidate division KSB3 bacterium]|uniref:RQC P-site tRNA stabilizing factor n=1 Tax=candidate division KSB3 bacterium TaxID=2044937 RepID=A0A2G6E265_9BACT|nr:MAG: hypothetical protein CSB45_13645 [candidate division KSB3 bacterium]PIE28603.1 MAG: hypothetical protein CSA57_13295 [candidate division KSB3 bacterium]